MFLAWYHWSGLNFPCLSYLLLTPLSCDIFYSCSLCIRTFCFPCPTPKSFNPLLKSDIFPEVSLNPHKNQLPLVPSSLRTVFDKDQVTFIFYTSEFILAIFSSQKFKSQECRPCLLYIIMDFAKLRECIEFWWALYKCLLHQMQFATKYATTMFSWIQPRHGTVGCIELIGTMSE